MFELSNIRGIFNNGLLSKFNTSRKGRSRTVFGIKVSKLLERPSLFNVYGSLPTDIILFFPKSNTSSVSIGLNISPIIARSSVLRFILMISPVTSSSTFGLSRSIVNGKPISLFSTYSWNCNQFVIFLSK